MELPVNYKEISQPERRKVREEYDRLQKGICIHCKQPLFAPPSKQVRDKKITLSLFPQGFLTRPIHLHHDHTTGMTIGAVHARCNAVLWQYYHE